MMTDFSRDFFVHLMSEMDLEIESFVPLPEKGKSQVDKEISAEPAPTELSLAA